MRLLRLIDKHPVLVAILVFTLLVLGFSFRPIASEVVLYDDYVLARWKPAFSLYMREYIYAGTGRQKAMLLGNNLVVLLHKFGLAPNDGKLVEFTYNRAWIRIRRGEMFGEELMACQVPEWAEEVITDGKTMAGFRIAVVIMRQEEQ